MANDNCGNCEDILSGIPEWDGVTPYDGSFDIGELDRYIIDNKLDIADFTDGNVAIRTTPEDSRRLTYWSGTKVFDVMMNAVAENLRIQFENGRIAGKEYAEVYTQSILGVLQTAVEFMKFDINQIIDAKIKVKSLYLDWWRTLNQINLEVYKTKVQTEQIKAQIRMECCKTKAQLDQIRAQARLLDRQFDGFDDNMYIKLLQYQMDAFAMIYSSGMLDDATLPAPINVNEMSDLYSLYKNRARDILTKHLKEEGIQPSSSLYANMS